MNNFFIDTVFAPVKGQPITAYFKDGTTADYTTDILELLKSDNSIDCITDGLTGEIIYQA